MKHYDKVYNETKSAMAKLWKEFSGATPDDYHFNGYTGANAVSAYLNQYKGINVTDCSTSNEAFTDALNS